MLTDIMNFDLVQIRNYNASRRVRAYLETGFSREEVKRVALDQAFSHGRKEDHVSALFWATIAEQVET